MTSTLYLGIAAAAALNAFACRSYRPTPGIHDALTKHGQETPGIAVPKPSVKGVSSVIDDIPPDDSLILSKFYLPSEVARYDRSCVVLERSGAPDIVLKDYQIGQPIDLEPFETYTLSVELYQLGVFVYSNAFCESKRSFTASLGRNIFTVPVCPASLERKAKGACTP